MMLTEAPIYLPDVNVLLALLSQDHIHNKAAGEWFSTSGIRWATCAFTEAGVIRLLMRSSTHGVSMDEATTLLQGMKQHPEFRYQPIAADWQTLTKPISKRIHGHNQVTDAFLLGIAIREGLVLTTFDKAFISLAGEHGSHVLLLPTVKH